MVKDKRYITVKILMEAGHVTDFAQIFEHIPLSVVAIDFGSNYLRFKRLVANPSRLKLIDVFILARLFEMPDMTMISLIIAQLSKGKIKK